MRIRFETTIGDWLELSRYEFANSDFRFWGVKLPIAGGFLLFAIIILSVAIDLLPGVGVPGQAAFIIAGCGVTLAMAFAIMKSIGWIHSWHIRRMLQGDDGVLKVGWHEMQNHDGILHVTTEMMMCRIDLRAIAGIVLSGRWAFILVESRPSFVVPLDQFANFEGHEFIAEVQEAWENCNHASSTEPPPLQMPAPDERFKHIR